MNGGEDITFLLLANQANKAISRVSGEGYLGFVFLRWLSRSDAQMQKGDRLSKISPRDVVR